jgi:hypothetical protein
VSSNKPRNQLESVETAYFSSEHTVFGYGACHLDSFEFFQSFSEQEVKLSEICKLLFPHVMAPTFGKSCAGKPLPTLLFRESFTTSWGAAAPTLENAAVVQCSHAKTRVSCLYRVLRFLKSKSSYGYCAFLSLSLSLSLSDLFLL